MKKAQNGNKIAGIGRSELRSFPRCLRGGVIISPLSAAVAALFGGHLASRGVEGRGRARAMVKARMRAKAASASQKSSDAAGKGVDAKDAAAEDAEHDKARRAFVVSSLLSPRSFPPSPSSE